MLRLDLSEIVRTVGMNQSYEIDEPPFVFDDIEFISPVVGSVDVINSGQVLLVRGKFKSAIDLECARCMADVRYRLDCEIEEQYTLKEVTDSSHHDVITRSIVQDEDNEVPDGLFDSLVMDLRVLIRQSAILASPITVLCKEDCAGLCPTCGINRNLAPCSCAKTEVNTPFAALRELLQQPDIE
jgi:uncharacterized protein